MFKSSAVRAGVFALLMAASVVLAAAWKPTRFIADSRPKVDLAAMIPAKFGDWQIDPSIVPLQPSPDLQQVIDATYDQTLARTYRNSRGQRVMLSMAYGRNQHEGMNTHRPEICYPAQGLPIVRGSQSGQVSAGPYSIPVTQLVARQGGRNEPITYWLIVGDQITTFGRNHKLLTLKYGFLGQIPDGILVRVSTIDPDEKNGFDVQARYIADLIAAVGPMQREQLLGRLVQTPNS